jgi:hypothetical protein
MEPKDIKKSLKMAWIKEEDLNFKMWKPLMIYSRSRQIILSSSKQNKSINQILNGCKNLIKLVLQAQVQEVLYSVRLLLIQVKACSDIDQTQWPPIHHELQKKST